MPCSRKPYRRAPAVAGDPRRPRPAWTAENINRDIQLYTHTHARMQLRMYMQLSMCMCRKVRGKSDWTLHRGKIQLQKRVSGWPDRQRACYLSAFIPLFEAEARTQEVSKQLGPGLLAALMPKGSPAKFRGSAPCLVENSLLKRVLIKDEAISLGSASCFKGNT